MAGLLDTQVNYSPFGENSIYSQVKANEQMQRAQQNNDINQQGALQDLFHNEQMNPLKVQGKSLENQGLEAGLPGIFADSESRQVKARKDKATETSDIEAHLSKNFADLSENDAKGLQSYASKLAAMAQAAEQGISLPQMQQLPPDLVPLMATPEGRAKLAKMAEGMSRYASGHLNKMAEIRATGDQWERRVNAQGENQLAVQRLKNQAAVEVANLRKLGTSSAAVKTAEGLYAKYADLAATEQDPDKQAAYNQLAQHFGGIFQQVRYAAAQASKAGTNVLNDEGQIAQMPSPEVVPTRVPTVVSTKPAAGASAPTPKKVYSSPQEWLADPANKNDPRYEAILKKSQGQ